VKWLAQAASLILLCLVLDSPIPIHSDRSLRVKRDSPPLPASFSMVGAGRGTLTSSGRVRPKAALLKEVVRKYLPVIQLPYARPSADEIGLPIELRDRLPSVPSENAVEVRGRRIPKILTHEELVGPFLRSNSVPLEMANTLSHVYFVKRELGRGLRADGTIVFFTPQVLLVKFRDTPGVAAVRVEPLRELASARAVNARRDVVFCELDTLQFRQFVPDDAQLSNQWHHATVDSYSAWDITKGSAAIRIAIVDTPFQMDHPDLAPNTDPGWNVVTNSPITGSPGIEHSTVTAGMAAAVLNNGLGVAGACNCRLVPIQINGFISEMYDAVIWAADHGVRVVNISWSGADDPILDDAGLHLKTSARGILVMSGVNGSGTLNYPAWPNIYCVSMTDRADNLRSFSGDHIDFAAPGYEIVSTTTNSSYTTASGTSFATPLFSGVVAALLSINPTLSPDEVIEILKSTAKDLGPPGWDRAFGWGRIRFGRAAVATRDTLPNIIQLTRSADMATILAHYRPDMEHTLWKASRLKAPDWAPVSTSEQDTNGDVISLTDPFADGGAAFYQVRASLVSTNPP
jgi:Subtilase family